MDFASASAAPRKSPLWVTLVIALVPCATWIAMTAMFTIQGGDFPASYTGAKIASQGRFSEMHDVHVQAQVQEEFAPGRPTVYFVRPHVYAALLSPLALLDLRPAFFAMAAVQGLVLLSVAIWAYRRFGGDAVILMACFPVGILAIGFGQDPVLYLGLAVLSYALYERGHLLGSGFALGCVFIKPHLLLLYPIVLVIQKRWRMLAGFAIGGAAEAAISLALGGLQGARTYVDFLKAQQGYLTPNPEHMINLQGLLVNVNGENTLVWASLAVVVLGAVVWIARQGEWWQALAAAQAGSILISPHIFMYDGAMLLLPALLLYFRSTSRAARIAAVVFLMPLGFFSHMADKPWSIFPAIAVLAVLATTWWETIAPAAQRVDARPRPVLL